MSVCTCPCEPSNHHARGECLTWYGDKNTGFQCNCHATPDQCQAKEAYAIALRKSRLALKEALAENARLKAGLCKGCAEYADGPSPKPPVCGNCTGVL